jgi:DNA-binding response OmpR family regulator
VVVEDEAALRDMVCGILETAGFDALPASNGIEALHVLRELKPDLVLLDVMLPGQSGLEILEMVCRSGETPVILLTALDAEENKVRGLRLGADDYITKPFSSNELLARIDAVLRRSTRLSLEDELSVGDVRIDVLGREVWVAGDLVATTAKEFDLLTFLARRPGQVYTRRQIMQEVWGGLSVDWSLEGTVTEHVRRLRLKLGSGLDRPQIQTVRGVGYRFRESDAATRARS